MTSLVPFEELHPLPTGDPETATSWILWHPRCGAYMLDAALEDVRGRVAALTVARGELTWSADVDSMASLAGSPSIVIDAMLPDETPASGPRLLAAALAAAHGPTPLRFRDGRSRADFERVMRAAGRLSALQGRGFVFIQAACAFACDKPIDRTRVKKGAIESEWEIAYDICAWFGPTSELRHSTSRRRASKRPSTTEFAQINLENDVSAPSAHELVEATRILADFYKEAANDLGLDESEIAARLDFLARSA